VARAGIVAVDIYGLTEVMGPGVPEPEAPALARELEHCIKTHIGVSTRVTVVAADGIERTLTGKARRVVDRRPRS
jgi:phenylacetate-CoA ligase